MPPRPRAKLADLPADSLRVSPAALPLTARAKRCVARWPSLGALVASPETELIAVRGLGQRSLAVVRRAVVEHVLAELMVPRTHRQWRALAAADSAVWEMEAQTRSLGAIVDDYLALLARYPLKKPRRRKRRPEPKPSPSLSQTVRAYFAPLEARERRVIEMRLGRLKAEGMSLGEIAREYRLSRERIRQILLRAEEKLADEAAREQRQATVRLLREAFGEPSRSVSEAELDAALRQKLRRPHAETGPFLRSVLHIEAEFAPAGARLWTWHRP